MQPDQASSTARRVAHHRLRLTRQPATFGRPADDDRLQADVVGDLDLGPSPMARYFQARTTWFDRVVLSGLGDGLDQVVRSAADPAGRTLEASSTSTAFVVAEPRSRPADALGSCSLGTS